MTSFHAYLGLINCYFIVILFKGEKKNQKSCPRIISWVVNDLTPTCGLTRSFWSIKTHSSNGYESPCGDREKGRLQEMLRMTSSEYDREL